MTTMNIELVNEPTRERAAAWLRRLGKAGFWFFLAKGLLWLAASYVACQAVGQP